MLNRFCGALLLAAACALPTGYTQSAQADALAGAGWVRAAVACAESRRAGGVVAERDRQAAPTVPGSRLPGQRASPAPRSQRATA